MSLLDSITKTTDTILTGSPGTEEAEDLSQDTLQHVRILHSIQVSNSKRILVELKCQKKAMLSP